MQLPLPCAGGFGVDVLDMVCHGCGNVVLSLRCSSIHAAGRHPGALAVSPAQLVTHHLPPADREVFLHLKVSPLKLVAVATVGA